MKAIIDTQMTGMDGDQLAALGGGRDAKTVAEFKKNAAALGGSIGNSLPSVDIDVASVGNTAQEAWDGFMGLFKILFGFLQVVSTLAINLPTVEWPASLTGLWDAVGVVANIDLMGGLAVDCIDTSWTFYQTFHATVAYPLALLFLVLVVTQLRLRATVLPEVSFSAEENLDAGVLGEDKFEFSAMAEDMVDLERERENIKVQAWKILLFGSFVIYPSVSVTRIQSHT